MPQRKWTIEVMADFDDQEKNDVITTRVRAAAALIGATTNLLADGVKPQVACWSDDFFGNHEDIMLVAKEIPDAEHVLEQQDDPSDELLAAARLMKK